MSDEIRDPIGEEANRRAHRVARAAVVLKQARLRHTTPGELAKFDARFRETVSAYEEIEERAMKEATL